MINSPLHERGPDHSHVDAAALAAGATAVVIAMFIDRGPFQPLGCVFSFALAAVVGGYVWPSRWHWPASIANATVLALIVLPIWGFALEMWWAADRDRLLTRGELANCSKFGLAFGPEFNLVHDCINSNVPQWTLAVAWVATAILVGAVDIWQQVRRRRSDKTAAVWAVPAITPTGDTIAPPASIVEQGAMTMNSDPKDAEAMTWEAAMRLVQDVEDAFGAADLTRIAQGFTEDAVARFADFPEMQGRDAIMAFLRARFARTKGYKLKKTLHVLMGDMLANTWDASWEDARTGKPMLGRGTEIWRVRDGRIALWDATFNVWEKGGPPATPVV